MKVVLNLLLFSLISSPQLFASMICDVKEYGAVGDGKVRDTEAIQKAIDECSKHKGKVLLRDGVFHTGMIVLKSNVTLHIEESATLKGSKKDSDYPELYPDSDNIELNYLRKALIYAEKAHNITIEGTGKIDGRGGKLGWRIPWIHEKKRPMGIFIVQSKNVLIQDLRIEDLAMWGVVTLETDDIVIRGLDIYSPYLPNRDGIDIVDGHNVLIENNTIYSQDDSICLKTGSKHGTENVIVRNNTILKSRMANGLKLGTASVGSFKNILFENNKIMNVALAAMTVESIDGAKVENVVFKDIHVKKSGTPFFVLLGSRKHRQHGHFTLPIGSIDGIHFINIQSDKTTKTWGSPIVGTVHDGVRYAPKNITFKNVHATFKGSRDLDEVPLTPKQYEGQYPDPHIFGKLPASGIYFRHIDGVSIEDSTFKSSWEEDPRPLIVKEDVR